MNLPVQNVLRLRLIASGAIRPLGSLTGKSAAELKRAGYPIAAKARGLRELGLAVNLSSPYGKVYR